MGRTVEQIVDCHRAAARRASRGLPIWDKKVDVRTIVQQYEEFGDDLRPEQAVELTRRVGGALRRGIPPEWLVAGHPNHTNEFDELLQRFEESELADFRPTAEYPDIAVDVVDEWLEELYTWADHFRVWLS